MKRHKNELLRFIFAIAIPAFILAGLGIFALRVGWLQAKANEQAELATQAELFAELLRSGARLYGFDRHGPPPNAEGRAERHEPDGPPPHEWKAWQIAILPGICREIEQKYGNGVDALAFTVSDSSHNVIFSSANYPAVPGMNGSSKLAPPLPIGEIAVMRADGGAGTRRAALRLVVSGGCIVALLVAALLAGGYSFISTLRRERLDALRKTDFLDNVSHELKTPLAGIRLNAELLEQGRIADKRKRRGALEAILIEADRLAQMVDKLLDFSRLEKGRFRYDIETFNLADFAAAPSEQQGVAAISNGRATIMVIGKCRDVVADKNAVRQIGINLVSNAMRYTEGAIEIEAEGCELRYMDRGPGLPPGDEERAFERFYRGDNSLTRKVGGSGLGLAIARSLARGMGGNLTYAHRKGGGAIFTLTLKSQN